MARFSLSLLLLAALGAPLAAQVALPGFAKIRDPRVRVKAVKAHVRPPPARVGGTREL